MSDKREAKKAALRTHLLEATTQQICQKGVEEIRARDIAKHVGCAVGSLYTAFEDLDDLILHVNSQTLQKLDEALTKGRPNQASPQTCMEKLACDYLDFASTHYRLWTALFDHKWPEGKAVPQWHLDNQQKLFLQIAGPLKELLPKADQDHLLLEARTFFAAIHGIITLSLQERYAAVDKTILKQQIIKFTHLILSGLQTQEDLKP
ncbi:MAG: TetR/AcrR family transcriptional regulator [Cohaesibacter sp.]|nr:TetR/AcrR family transcriptional regulator [Cohaesibacter sp.]